MNPAVEKLLRQVSVLETPEKKYEWLIQKGKAIPALPSEEKQEKYLIKGCQSQAWLVPDFQAPLLYFKADSDALIVKGIMACLLDVYSGNKPEENLAISPEFLREAGILEQLSLSRRNGLSNLLKQIMLYSQVFSVVRFNNR